MTAATAAAAGQQLARLRHHILHVRDGRLSTEFVHQLIEAGDQFRIFHFRQRTAARSQLHTHFQRLIEAAVRNRFPITVLGQADDLYRLVAD